MAVAPRAVLGPLSTPATDTPLYETVLAWATACVRARGYPRPLCKRLAVLVTGLLAGSRATVGSLAETLHALALSPAREPSIVRRLGRVLDDPRLDPERLLADVYAAWLPALLAEVLAAHAGAEPRDRRPWVRLVLDETTVLERIHVLVLGLAVPGLVLPLGVRCWWQNQPLAEGSYWAELSTLLWGVQRLLPTALRGHVLLVADRAYGVPRLLDLAAQVGWDVAVRAQGQVRVRLRSGSVRPLRELVPRPGTTWTSGTAEAALNAEGEVCVFKQAGWRRCRVAAAWAVGQAEPWLVLTTLPTDAAALRAYAGRWAIERLFLSWKSHGWDLEACGVPNPARLGRLLSGLSLATAWTLSLAWPAAQAELARLADPLRPDGGTRQLPLPWDARPRRPWAAKFSLLRWGRKVAARTTLRTHTPPWQWPLPPWPALTWTAHCAEALTHAAA